MGCFCQASATALAAQLPQLELSASLNLSLGLPGADVAMALSAWLSARGLPAAPWQPDPAWLQQQLPMPQLSASAIATISALVQLRAQALAQFGIDLLIPQQANAFARIVASMNAHLAVAMPATSAAATLNPAPLVMLANLNAAIEQVQAALTAGLLVPSPPPGQMLALTQPGGIPIGRWGGLLRPLRMLAPLIAASLQLGASISDTVQLAAALRVLARINLPALAAPGLVASLSATLSAMASLNASFGAATVKAGLPAVRVQVQARLSALLATLSARFAINLTGIGAAALAQALEQLLAMLPKLPVVPSSLATADVVRLAMQAQALASVNWQVPTSLPAIATGLATCTLAAQMQVALGIQAVMPTPCGSGCDAAALLRAALAA
jgi:hypothetical protein